MLGALFNRNQGGDSSTGSQNVRTSLRSFMLKGDPVGYSEFIGLGQPTTKYGLDGDVYVDQTPEAMALYGHDGNGWKPWPGPTAKTHISHPKDANRWLWCNGKNFGWLPRGSRATYSQSHTESELLTLAIEKKSEPPKKRKSYDAGSTQPSAPKKPKTEFREGSSTTHNSEGWRRSVSGSVGPAPGPSSAAYSPEIPPPHSAARSASYSDANTNAYMRSSNEPSVLHVDEKADLLREICDLRASNALSQRQLAAAHAQIAELQEANAALRQQYSNTLSRLLIGAGISYDTYNRMAGSEPSQAATAVARSYSLPTQSTGAVSTSGSRTMAVIPIPLGSSETSSTLAESSGIEPIGGKTILENAKIAIAAAHTQLDQFIAADAAPINSHQLHKDEDVDIPPVVDEDSLKSAQEKESVTADDGDGVDGKPDISGDGLVDDGPAEGPNNEVDLDIWAADSVSSPSHAGSADSQGLQPGLQITLSPNIKHHVALDEDEEHATGPDDEMMQDHPSDDDAHKPEFSGSGEWEVLPEQADEESENGVTDYENEEDEILSSHAGTQLHLDEDEDEDVGDTPGEEQGMTPDTALPPVKMDDGSDEDAKASEILAAPPTREVDIPRAHPSDKSFQRQRSISVVEETPEYEEPPKTWNPILQNEPSPVVVHATDSPPPTSAPTDTSVHDESISMETNSVSEHTDDVDDGAKTPLEAVQTRDSPTRLTVRDILPTPIQEPENLSRLSSQSPAVDPTPPPSWISQTLLPILVAEIPRKYQLCRLCLTSTPRVITKFPLTLDLPAMEAHFNKEHEDYCAVLHDLTPQDLQDLLNSGAYA